MARRKFDEGDVFRVAEGVYFEITDVGGGFVGGDIELEATPLFPEGYVELAIRELRRLERVPPEVWAAMCAANYAAMPNLNTEIRQPIDKAR